MAALVLMAILLPVIMRGVFLATNSPVAKPSTMALLERLTHGASAQAEAAPVAPAARREAGPGPPRQAAAHGAADQARPRWPA